MKPQIKDEKDFLVGINQAIRENRHVDYLQEVLKKYEEYKNEFNEIFTEKDFLKSIYTFRVTYLLKKPVWREIEILGKQPFNIFAEIIIDSMGWENDHMHGFGLIRKKKSDPLFTGSSLMFVAPFWEDDPHPTFKTNEIKICDIDYIKNPKLRFIFDFGDGHEFIVEFKKLREMNKRESVSDFPKIVDMRGVGPEQYPELD